LCIGLIGLLCSFSRPSLASESAVVPALEKASRSPGFSAADTDWDLESAHRAEQAGQLARALMGTTRQAERIANSIHAGKMQVHVLSNQDFDQRYQVVGGSSYALAFSYGSEVFLRANSPSTLSDLVHEGTHVLDYLSRFAKSRRHLELRAYYYEHQFQKSVGDVPQFDNLFEVLRFVSRY
jgi:hypothetical protein